MEISLKYLKKNFKSWSTW